LITAIDTSVLLDIIGADPKFGPRSAAGLRRCQREGQLVACDVVWAECAAALPDAETTMDRLTKLRIGFNGLDTQTALAAGSMWRVYRSRHGTCERMITDFLIGAHALLQADRLLTRDRCFHRNYFENLEIIDPPAS
jgi:predicted nucleic acid-binding protein